MVLRTCLQGKKINIYKTNINIIYNDQLAQLKIFFSDGPRGKDGSRITYVIYGDVVVTSSLVLRYQAFLTIFVISLGGRNHVRLRFSIGQMEMVVRKFFKDNNIQHS